MPRAERAQQRLSDLGYYNGYVNGELYDDEVTNCLATFQKKNGLVADGIAGVETQKKLFADDAVPVMEDWDMPVSNDGPTQEWVDQMIADAQKAKEAIEKNTDENGILTLRMNYLVYPFADGEIGEPTEGTATFKVKTK